MVEGFNVYTGRGGAGNIVSSSEKPSPKVVPQGSQTPNLLQPVFSTGRGGAGNMRKNVDQKLTRKAQDVDDFIPPADGDINPVNLDLNVQSAKSHDSHAARSYHSANTPLRPKGSRQETPQSISIGRGGAGNILSPTNSRKSKTGTKAHKNGSKSGLWANVKRFFK
ncbi:LAME_0C04324g1_1 [Lachancea meyersii CBS 8951]|uniref:LAME_0C04324g1_1 n=1 Tax=Lachancea meyersii CBS 8951 TaxID=1266667 RepID=A0A1G4J1I8_9SACH|nr:LAME_0C04324g1_1 [Lachancea meyersii CBS 8951]